MNRPTIASILGLALLSSLKKDGSKSFSEMYGLPRYIEFKVQYSMFYPELTRGNTTVAIYTGTMRLMEDLFQNIQSKELYHKAMRGLVDLDSDEGNDDFVELYKSLEPTVLSGQHLEDIFEKTFLVPANIDYNDPEFSPEFDIDTIEEYFVSDWTFSSELEPIWAEHRFIENDVMTFYFDIDQYPGMVSKTESQFLNSITRILRLSLSAGLGQLYSVASMNEVTAGSLESVKIIETNLSDVQKFSSSIRRF